MEELEPKIESIDNTNTDTTAVQWIDVLLLLLKWKKRILISVVSVMVLTALITLTMDKWYESKVVIVLPEKTASPLDAISGSLGGLGASLFGVSSGTGANRYLSILNSRRLREALIEKYDLKTAYDAKNVEDVLKALETDLVAEQDKKLGSISVTMRHMNNPELTAEMANYVVDKLDEINRELATEQARYSRQFIEERYKQARKDLQSVEDSLNVFQKKYGVIALPEQTKASIEAAAQLQAQVTATETEYNVKKKTLGNNHPDLMRLESEIEELKKTQRQMEFGGVDLNIFIPFKNAPDLGLKYLRLYREVQINSKIVEYLVPQYEQAKIQEAKDTPTLLVLDKAKPAEYSYKPRKKAVVASAGLIILIFFVGLAFGTEYLKYHSYLKLKFSKKN